MPCGIRSNAVCSRIESTRTRPNNPAFVISLIGNRPALQIGRYQVIDYDTAWLDAALLRAARAADREDFPFVDDIRSGIVKYLETKCPLKLLQLDELFNRVRRMLVKIGCESIAEHLVQLAPPVTVPLVRAAVEAGNGFELAFFATLRAELRELRAAGAEEIHFSGLRESALILRGAAKWNKQCEKLLTEIRAFLEDWECGQLSAGRLSHPCVESGC